MRKIVQIISLIAIIWTTLWVEPGRAACELAHYPEKSWERVTSPEQVGWSSEKLKAARGYSASIGSSAVMIIHGGKILDEWGETARRYKCHSMRKSLLNALYGIYVKEGKINLQSRLVELGIDDKNPGLSDEEKQARVEDLLKSRSGVYHAAAAEIHAMAALRPRRGEHKPGAFWYYNNWDFNALGTIFEQSTKSSIGWAFKERIADPIRMEDFRAADVGSSRIPQSVHAAYLCSPHLLPRNDRRRCNQSRRIKTDPDASIQPADSPFARDCLKTTDASTIGLGFTLMRVKLTTRIWG